MKLTTTICFILFLLSSPILGQDWTLQTSGTDLNLHDVYFTTKDSGWTVGNSGTLLRTTNGGNTWTAQSSGITEDFRGVAFKNSEVGIGVAFGGKIVRTANGGGNWTAVTSNTPRDLRSVSFAHPDTVWAVGGGGFGPVILKSGDAGSNWVSTPVDGSPTNILDVFFLNSMQGWICGETGYIRYTIDGGQAWSAPITGPSTGSFTSIHFANEEKGWAVTTSGQIWHSNDGGVSWFQQNSANAGLLNGVFAVSASEVWVVGDGGAVRYTDSGGSTWLNQDIPLESDDFNDIFFIDANTGWIVGEDGKIYAKGVMSDIKVVDHLPGMDLKPLWPNPVFDQLNIAFTLDQGYPMQMVLRNAAGQEIRMIADQFFYPGDHRLEVSMNDHPQGVYYIELQTEGYRTMRKVIRASEN